MKVTRRIQEIINFSKSGKRVCDIGCDHGLVGISLIKDYNIEYVIFSDIVSAPLQNAIDNVKEYEIDCSIVDFRVGDGLTTIKVGEVDTVVITGMGGKTIVDILANNIEKTRSYETFILQPTNGEKLLRKWLCENSFVINDETLIEESNVFYETFLISKGKSILSEQELTFGKYIDYNDNTFITKYNKVLDKLISIRNDIPEEYSEQIDKFNYEITMIEEVLKRIDRK
ncbi:MAG: tRNA (adenine(22)-N(1))-methyltransferase [Bacilli bacterium]